MFQSDITSLPLVARGKVRDIYAVGDDQLLLVTSDRLSAYDVILPTPIPHKGEILVGLANFWFEKLKHIVPNQLTGIDPESVVAPNERDQVRGRAIVVKRYKVLPIEAVVRGYLEGSGWAEYQQSQSVCGVKLPAGLQRASKLPEPIFTPATKAQAGEHDENIDFATCEKIIGAARAAEVRDVAIGLYKTAADYALTRGIIIADTKFEFGLDAKGQLHLIDEALTPDSSRFWPLDTYQVGVSPESFDKQYIRNWLDSIGFNRKPPAPD
ncbi:MAG: phosphoribosylaminoimidazolesuccinocarboxamide synthase, partial [Betaproteobacteria bacterium]